MRKERCWVWFKGGLSEEGHWMSGLGGQHNRAAGPAD